MEQDSLLRRGSKRNWPFINDACIKNPAQNRMRMLRAQFNSDQVCSNNNHYVLGINDKYIQSYSSGLKHPNNNFLPTTTRDENSCTPLPSKRVAHIGVRYQLPRSRSFENEDSKIGNFKVVKRHEKQSKSFSPRKSVNNRLTKIRQQAMCNNKSPIATFTISCPKEIIETDPTSNDVQNMLTLTNDPTINVIQTEPIQQIDLSIEYDDILNNEDFEQEDTLMDWNTIPSESTLLNYDREISEEKEKAIDSPSLKEVDKQGIIYIIPDTNVFINNLHTVVDVVNYKGPKKIQLHIPWMVLKELEHFKDDATTRQSLKAATMRAERFINTNLKMQETKVFGQSLEEFINQKDIGVSPDDKILACCMQLLEKCDSTILLTNDVNLSNKALINRIEVCSPSEIILMLHSKVKQNITTLKISQKMSKLLSQIICDLCQEAYKDVWQKMHMLHSPPWSLFDCLKILKKYWRSVFRIKLLKQSLEPIEELHRILLDNKGDVPNGNGINGGQTEMLNVNERGLNPAPAKNENICDNSEIFREFTKQAKMILIFLRDMSEYKAAVQGTLTEIQALTSS